MTDRPLLAGLGADALRKSDHRIVITGAGGWIGMATLELLRNSLSPAAFGKRVCAFGSSARTLQLRDRTHVLQQPLTSLANLPSRPTILLHTAFLTKDRAEWMSELEYIAQNEAIRATVRTSLDTIGVDRLFLASSGAAYYTDDQSASPAMRLYGAMKREDERCFSDWAEQTNNRAVIGRLFALSGPYINKPETYALASFILDAINGRRIRVKATRPVIRGYVAIRELMSLVLALLETRSGIVRFDTGGEAMELGRAAAIVSEILGGHGADRATLLTKFCDSYAGDDAVYQQLLGSVGIQHVPFRRQVMETAEFLSNDVPTQEALSA